jgi:hypothetical protein
MCYALTPVMNDCLHCLSALLLQGRLLHGGGSSGGQQRAGKYGGNRGSVNASACELLLSPDVPLVRLKRLMGDTDPASLDVLRKACEVGCLWLRAG